MSQNFGRFVSVVLQQYQYKGGKKVIANTQVVVNDLRVTFHVQKSWLPQPNPAIVQIFNLAEDNRDYIDAHQCELSLYAGYEDRWSLLFSGDVAKATTKRQDGDIVTEIEAGDGEFLLGRKTVSRSFSPGVTTGNVMDYLTTALGFATGQIKGFDPKQQYTNGFSFTGYVRDAMDILMGKQGLEWSVQDQKLYVLPEKTATDDEIIVLTPDTGLVGSPFKVRVLRQEQAKKQQGQLAESGCQIMCNLESRLFPGRRFEVKSQFVSGTFKARQVIHKGDTHAAPWYTEVEGI